MASIKDMLEALDKPKDNSGISAGDMWEMIASGESLEKMGFSDESEKADWILQNPYDNI